MCLWQVNETLYLKRQISHTYYGNVTDHKQRWKITTENIFVNNTKLSIRESNVQFREIYENGGARSSSLGVIYGFYFE